MTGVLIRGWQFHITRLTFGILLALLAGWLTGYEVAIPAGFLLVYLAWQSYNSVRLYNWLLNWDKEPPYSLGMWSEIFNRIDALQKLNNRRNREYQEVIDDFQAMADAFPDAALVLDSDDTITWFNEPAVKLLNLRPPDDRGQAVTNLIRGPEFANWLVIQEQVQRKLEMPCPIDNNITLQVSMGRVRKDQRLLILRDVTDIRNMDRVRRDFIANASHELKTPLTVLLGYLEILSTQQEKPPADAVMNMYEQATQMNAMLDDLLELSRLQDQEAKQRDDEVDVPAMLGQLRRQIVRYSKGAHKILFDIEHGLRIYGVESDLKSAFQNLLVNAVDYTADNGCIRVSWQSAGDGLVFSVKDNGIGIPDHDIPRLTERFYRVGNDRARSSGGTGLGLAIVKHVLNTHQAKLEISSKLGKGSEFRCVFPLHRQV